MRKIKLEDIIDCGENISLQINYKGKSETFDVPRRIFLNEVNRILNQNLGLTESDYHYLKGKSIKGQSCLPGKNKEK